MNHKFNLELMQKGVFPSKWEYDALFDFQCNVLRFDNYQIISFLGTKSIVDVLLDLLFIPWPYRFRLVHLGISLGMRTAWKKYISKKVDFNKKTYVVGHSLGGARAKLFHIIYGSKFKDIRTVSFGSPRVEWFLTRFIGNKNLDIVRYENSKDVFTKLPPTWLGFFHHGKRITFGSKKFLPLFDQSRHAEGYYMEDIKNILL